MQRGLEGFPGVHFAFSSVLFIIWCCKKRMPCNSFGCVASCFVFTAWKGNGFCSFPRDVCCVVNNMGDYQPKVFVLLYISFFPPSLFLLNTGDYQPVLFKLFITFYLLLFFNLRMHFFLLIRIFVGYLFCIVLHL